MGRNVSGSGMSGTLRRFVNIGELFYDLLMLAVVTVAADLVFPGGAPRISPQNAVYFVPVVFLMDLFIPMYMGLLYASYRRVYGPYVPPSAEDRGKTGGAEETNGKWRWHHAMLYSFSHMMPWIIFPVLGILIPVIMGSLISYDSPYANIVPDYAQIMIIVFTGTALMIGGWYAGSTGGARPAPAEGKTFLGMSRRSIIIIACLFGIPGAIAAIPSFYKFPFYYALVILGIVAGMILGIIGFVNMIRSLLRNDFFREYMMPVMVPILLACYYMIHGILAQSHGGNAHVIARQNAFLVYCILPVRLFMLFAPPVRLINFLIWLAALALAVRSLSADGLFMKVRPVLF